MTYKFVPRNCYHLVCTKCRGFGPRKGGKFYFRNGIKSFVCAKCVAKKEAA